MPRKAAAAEPKIVTLVPQKGVKLPVTECVLSKETPAEYLVQAAAKTGRGRGVKYLLRTFRIPKEHVLYLYKEEEISAEAAESFPMNGTSVKAKAAPVKAATAPKKRGRPKGSTKAAPKKDAAPKKRGRPKGSTSKKATEADAPKKRGRPKGSTNKKAATKKADAPKKRGRPKGSKNKKAEAAPKKAAVKKEAAPKKAAPKKEAAPKAPPTKAASIFDEDF